MSNCNSTRPSIERIQSLYSYDPLRGVLLRKFWCGQGPVGSVAGSLKKTGYRMVKIDGAMCAEHRVIWAVVHGAWPENVIDHIDGDPSNNRIENLRDIPRAMNLQNQRKASAASQHGFLGVSPHGGKFQARIRVDKKPIHLGTFATPELAYQAYLKAKRSLHPACTI